MERRQNRGASHFDTLYVTVLNTRGVSSLPLQGNTSMTKLLPKSNAVEPEKVIAERINGCAAMLGVIAAVGAYLTTGQILPGFI